MFYVHNGLITDERYEKMGFIDHDKNIVVYSNRLKYEETTEIHRAFWDPNTGENYSYWGINDELFQKLVKDNYRILGLFNVADYGLRPFEHLVLANDKKAGFFTSSDAFFVFPREDFEGLLFPIITNSRFIFFPSLMLTETTTEVIDERTEYVRIADMTFMLNFKKKDCSIPWYENIESYCGGVIVDSGKVMFTGILANNLSVGYNFDLIPALQIDTTLEF